MCSRFKKKKNMFRRVLEQVRFRAASWWYQTSLQVACSATGQRLGIQPTKELVCRPMFPTSSAEGWLMPLADRAQTWPSTQDSPLAHPRVTQFALCTLPSHGRLTASARPSPPHPLTRCALICRQSVMICQSSVSCLYSLLCLVRLVCRILWCSAPVDIPTFSVESGGELKKIDFYQGRYSSAD